jgi:hypothetical protein
LLLQPESDDANHQIPPHRGGRGFLEKLVPQFTQGWFAQMRQRDEAPHNRRVGHSFLHEKTSTIDASFAGTIKSFGGQTLVQATGQERL